MKPVYLLWITIFSVSILLASCGNPPPTPSNPTNADTSAQNPTSASSGITGSSGVVNIKGEVWADNWFAFYSGDTLIKEDSVPITTERSFNAEVFTFSATYPLQLNFIAKDFKENDTGLEYIGSPRQQMGDGGLIAQFTNADTGVLIAATDSTWTCLVIHEAPLDTACAKEANPVAGQGSCGFTAIDEPAGWKESTFDDSSWSRATIYTAQEVGPKDGYDQIRWNSLSQLIWGPDLKKDNTILCRLTVK